MEVNPAKGAAWDLWVWISNSIVELRGGKEEAKTKVFMKITPIRNISMSKQNKKIISSNGERNKALPKKVWEKSTMR